MTHRCPRLTRRKLNPLWLRNWILRQMQIAARVEPERSNE